MSQFLKKIIVTILILANAIYVIINRTERPQIAMKDSLSMQYIAHDQSKLKHLNRNRMISNADINQNLSLIKTNNVHTQEESQPDQRTSTNLPLYLQQIV